MSSLVGLPPSLPMPRLVQTLRYVRNPLPLLDEGARRIGDMYALVHRIGAPAAAGVSGCHGERIAAQPALHAGWRRATGSAPGGGIRRCLGYAFALFEMKTLIATVLSGVRLRIENANAKYVRCGFFLAPEGGPRVVRAE